MAHGEYCVADHLCDACDTIERLQKDLEDARLATHCFVRQFQIEGGIVTLEDVERWPWIIGWVFCKDGDPIFPDCPANGLPILGKIIDDGKIVWKENP
jgi:hypothetical protein